MAVIHLDRVGILDRAGIRVQVGTLDRAGILVRTQVVLIIVMIIRKEL